MKTLWNEYRNTVALGLFVAVVLILLAGCMSPGPQVPASQTDADRFAKAFVQLTDAYSALLIANTPVVEGAKPVLSDERTRQILTQLDNVKLALETADDLRIAGRGGYQDPESIERTLRAIRAQIPEKAP